MTTNSKKIVLIGPMPPFRGGIARFTASLAEELLDMGHDVNVISYRKQYPKLLYPGKTAMEWIKANTNQDVVFGINTNFLNPTMPYGTDAGYWLPVYAERQTTALTLLSSLSDDYQYDLERYKTTPEFYKTGDLSPLCAYGIDSLYSGAKDPLGSADLAKLPNLLGNEKIKLIYEKGSVQLFKICD